MRIIVDANIAFSGILNTNGRIGDILINSKRFFNFIAPEFLRFEIKKHYPRLSSISGLSLAQIQEAEFQIYQNITFVSEEQIKRSIWTVAERLVVDVDINDIQYIAFSKQFRCKIWSGDKALIRGLLKKDFTSFVSTEELFDLRQEMLKGH